MDLSARFSVYKITANGPNKYSVETHIVRDMLSSENFFLEKTIQTKLLTTIVSIKWKP